MKIGRVTDDTLTLFARVWRERGRQYLPQLLGILSLVVVIAATTSFYPLLIKAAFDAFADPLTAEATGFVRRAERLSREHWTLVYLQQHPGWQGEGVLVEKRAPRGTVLVPALALETRLKIADSIVPDSVLPLRLAGLDLPAREAYFKLA